MSIVRPLIFRFDRDKLRTDYTLGELSGLLVSIKQILEFEQALFRNGYKKALTEVRA